MSTAAAARLSIVAARAHNASLELADAGGSSYVLRADGAGQLLLQYNGTSQTTAVFSRADSTFTGTVSAQTLVGRAMITGAALSVTSAAAAQDARIVSESGNSALTIASGNSSSEARLKLSVPAADFTLAVTPTGSLDLRTANAHTVVSVTNSSVFVDGTLRTSDSLVAAVGVHASYVSVSTAASQTSTVQSGQSDAQIRIVSGPARSSSMVLGSAGSAGNFTLTANTTAGALRLTEEL